MDFPNYYKILELDKTASEEQIWLSYHKLAFLEAQKKDADLKKMFWLTEAYESLKNPAMRKMYDQAFSRYLHFNMSVLFRTRLAIFLTGFCAEVAWFLLTHLPSGLR